MQICPIGVPGILYIAGRGVAKGYLGDLHKKKQAFFENFFGDGSIYCTGESPSVCCVKLFPRMHGVILAFVVPSCR